MHLHRNPAPVVLNTTTPARLDAHDDVIAVAPQRFVDGVIQDLVHQVMETVDSAITDIHVRTLPDGFQSL
ncbi:MAG: hypothetical protein MI702_05835 [Chlorobiales bacterium]|nr:hypothetical protein [Chlorobiales bacterium]